MVCDSKIDVVASEQQVIADGDTLDMGKGCSGLAADLEETEIGSSPADVDDDDATGANFRKLQWIRRGMPFEPAVKCGLRFLQEANVVRKPRLAGGVQGEPLSHCVELCGNGKGDFLMEKRRFVASKSRIPGSAQVFEQECRCLDRRDPLFDGDFVRSPWEKRGTAVDRVMAEPRLGGVSHATGRFRSPLPSESSGNPFAAAGFPSEHLCSLAL